MPNTDGSIPDGFGGLGEDRSGNSAPIKVVVKLLFHENLGSPETIVEQPLGEIAFQTSFSPRPVSGPFLDLLLRCDEFYSGTLGRTFLASPLRRQGIFLVLSQLNPDRPQDLADRLGRIDDQSGSRGCHPLATVARILLQRRVRDIVRILHRDATGLVSSLGKLGADPLSIEGYHTLTDLHTKPEHRLRVRLLRRAPKIPKRAIPILVALEPPYVTLPLLKRLESVQEARDFRRSIALIKKVVSHVTDEQLLASLATLKSETSLGQWVKRWLSRATTFCMPPPIHDDPDLVYLGSAAALRDAGRRYKNCLAEKTTFCALGRAAYLEYRPVPAIIELQALDRGYVLEHVYGRRNSSVDQQTACAIITKLRTAGILVPARDAQAMRLNRVAQFAHLFDFTRDDLDLLDDPTDWTLDLEVDDAA